jgi:hypothetical protein
MAHAGLVGQDEFPFMMGKFMIDQIIKNESLSQERRSS